MKNYYRITAYHKTKDFTVILDCFNLYQELWEFSAFLITKGFKILEVGETHQFIEGNIPLSNEHPKKFIVRATQDGMPDYKYVNINGSNKKAVCVSYKYYVPLNK